MTISSFKDRLAAKLHGRTLDRVRDIEGVLETAANTLQSKVDLVETMRNQALANTIYDDVFNYPLPSDFKSIIDLYPQASRDLSDTAKRYFSGYFDLRKSLATKMISIEGSEGSKILRVNWRHRAPKTLHTMNDYDGNGTWSAVGTTSGIADDNIDYVSGSGSLKFDLVADGDGIQITDMSDIDLTDEDEVGDLFLWIKIKYSIDLANFNSITLIWGNDLTANYWTGVTQTTQADGTAFKVGWNQIKIPWSTATETGTVDPAAIDSLKLTIGAGAAISDLRVDNITCGIGKSFDIKYYSKYILQNSASTWISRTASDDDTIVLDNDGINLYLLEAFIEAAHQAEGENSAADIAYAKNELNELYRRYKLEHPSQSKKAVSSYGSPVRIFKY